LEPIRRETVMDTVARRIEQLVRGGDLKPGDRLPPEPELAHRFAQDVTTTQFTNCAKPSALIPLALTLPMPW
jgi:hypothetical protein